MMLAGQNRRQIAELPDGVASVLQTLGRTQHDRRHERLPDGSRISHQGDRGEDLRSNRTAEGLGRFGLMTPCLHNDLLQAGTSGLVQMPGFLVGASGGGEAGGFGSLVRDRSSHGWDCRRRFRFRNDGRCRRDRRFLFGDRRRGFFGRIACQKPAQFPLPIDGGRRSGSPRMGLARTFQRMAGARRGGRTALLVLGSGLARLGPLLEPAGSRVDQHDDHRHEQLIHRLPNSKSEIRNPKQIQNLKSVSFPPVFHALWTNRRRRCCRACRCRPGRS